MSHHRYRLGLVALCTAALAAVVRAGSRDPPGPPAPTMKTLVEVEPRILISSQNTPGDADSLFKIVQPGSYYLGGNVTGARSLNRIEIAAADVTLDLLNAVGEIVDFTNTITIDESESAWANFEY